MKTAAVLALALLVMAALNASAPVLAQGKGRGVVGKSTGGNTEQNLDRRGGQGALGQAAQTDQARRPNIDQTQGGATADGLPPGLAKRENLPPGLAKRETLPPGLAKGRSTPPGLANRQQLPPGLRR